MQDYKDIVRIWKDAFGDEEEFISEYLTNFGTESNYILFKNPARESCGMIHYPSFIDKNGLKVGYLYALAVDEKFRNKGIARLLVNELFIKSDCDVVITIPEPDTLRSWYQNQFGFTLRNDNYDINLLENLNFDLGTGDRVRDIFMVRVTNINSYLEVVAHNNPDINVTIEINDNLNKNNNGIFTLSNGFLIKESENEKVLGTYDISEVYSKFPLSFIN